MKLVKTKQEGACRADKLAVADSLKKKEFDLARIKVEAVLNKLRLIEALELVHLMTSLLKERFDLIVSEKQCPLDLHETVMTIVWAASRVPVAELKVVAKQLVHKYGDDFFAADHRAEAKGMSRVNPKVRADLTAAVPSDEIKNDLLVKIATEFKVPDFDPLRDLADSKVGLFPAAVCAGDAPGGCGASHAAPSPAPAAAAACSQCTANVCPHCHGGPGGGNNGGGGEGFFPPPGYNPHQGFMPPAQQLMPGLGPQAPVSFINTKTGEVIPNAGMIGGQQMMMGLPVGFDALAAQGGMQIPQAAPANLSCPPAAGSELEYQMKKLGYIPGAQAAPSSASQGSVMAPPPADIDPSYMVHQAPPGNGAAAGGGSGFSADMHARLQGLGLKGGM